MAATSGPPRTAWWRSLGPGFLVAATGVGAGDLIAAAVAGQRFGLAVLWAVALGALFKWVLNEGVSRWQLATGTTLIEGWITRLPRWVSGYFLGFLVLWSALVAAALAAACGVAAHALVGGFISWPTPMWSALHAAVGFVLVWRGGYSGFEKLMKVLMALMFVSVVVCALMMRPDPAAFLRGLMWPGVPRGSGSFVLSIMGGVGGSVTLLCYGYWIREKGWQGAHLHRRSLLDLGSAYLLTGLFGLAMIVIAAEAKPVDASGAALALALADQLHVLLGPTGRWCFLVGFWCAVFTSLLGVWQGVPYLFADYIATLRRRRSASSEGAEPLARSPAYRWFLAYLAFPPLLLLLWGRPVTIVIIYAVAGAFFMPFLAAVLLVMNNRGDWVGDLKNPRILNALLVLSLVLFGCLFVIEVAHRLGAQGDALG